MAGLKRFVPLSCRGFHLDTHLSQLLQGLPEGYSSAKELDCDVQAPRGGLSTSKNGQVWVRLYLWLAQNVP